MQILPENCEIKGLEKTEGVDHRFIFYGGYSAHVDWENENNTEEHFTPTFFNTISLCSHSNTQTTCTSLWTSGPKNSSHSYPAPRAFHTATLEEIEDKVCSLVISGGMPANMTSYTFYSRLCGMNDIWSYNFATAEWTEIKPNTAPCPPHPVHTYKPEDKPTQSTNPISPALWVVFSLGVAVLVGIIGVYVYREIRRYRAIHYSAVSVPGQL